MILIEKIRNQNYVWILIWSLFIIEWYCVLWLWTSTPSLLIMYLIYYVIPTCFSLAFAHTSYGLMMIESSQFFYWKGLSFKLSCSHIFCHYYFIFSSEGYIPFHLQAQEKIRTRTQQRKVKMSKSHVSAEGQNLMAFIEKT